MHKNINIRGQTSDKNLTRDHQMDIKQQHDRVVFENVADQYVQGQDITAFFIIYGSTKINPDEDQIGLLRIGCTNMKECLAYTPVQFNSTSESIRSGTATFPSSSLRASDDEFYQFCYINNKTKNLGSSIPFQLNCTLDDIDLLSNTSLDKSKGDDLLVLSDHDNDDIVIIHTKCNRAEKHPLLNINGNKISNDTPATGAEMYRSLSDQYQGECLEYAERCQTLEDAQRKSLTETDRIRSQLNVTFQLVKDQATQVVDLERRLMQANDLIKVTNEEKQILEQRLNDTNLTFEKYQRSTQGQLNATSKLTKEQTTHINNLERQLKQSNESLTYEKMLLEQQLRDLRLTSEKYQMSTQGQLNEYAKQVVIQQEQMNVLERSNSLLCEEISEENPNDGAYMALKVSYNEIEKRCIKHKKNEVELRRHLSTYQINIDDLQREIQDLTERLTKGAEEYKTLFRKYRAFEQEKTPVSLGNTSENCQEQKTIVTPSSLPEVEIQECPICNYQFSKDVKLDQKQEHIEEHFQ